MRLVRAAAAAAAAAAVVVVVVPVAAAAVVGYLLQKVKLEMGRPDWHVSTFDKSTCEDSCPCHVGLKGYIDNWFITLSTIRYYYGKNGLEKSDRADRLASITTITSGLRLGRSEVLRSLRHYLRARHEHHTIARSEERGVNRSSARRSSVKRRVKAIVSKTNLRTASKAMLGKLLRDGMERLWAFPGA